jgi:hypothetical protein
MSKAILLACLVTPLLAVAGGPDDPSAKVPPTRYQSPLPPSPPPPAPGAPDQNWKKANDKAAETDSMSLTMDPPKAPEKTQ